MEARHGWWSQRLPQAWQPSSDRAFRFAIIVLSVLALDLATKAGVVSLLHLHQPLLDHHHWWNIRPVLNATQFLGAWELSHTWFVARHFIAVPVMLIACWLATLEIIPPVARWGLGLAVGGMLAALLTLPLTGWATLDFLEVRPGVSILSFNVVDLALVGGWVLCWLAALQLWPPHRRTA